MHEAMGYYDASFGFSFHGGSISAESIFIGGTEKQKQFAAEKLLEGKNVCLLSDGTGRRL